MPRAYSEMILSSKPSRRVSPLATICGSKLPLRSRGTSISTDPSSVSTVLGDVPLRVLAGSAAGGIALFVTEMVRQLGAQRPLEQRLLELLEQAVLAQQVLRLLVAGQELVKMFWLHWHRVVPFVRLPTECPHTIFLTLPHTPLLAQREKRVCT